MKTQLNRTNRYITQMLGKDRLSDVLASQGIARNRFEIFETLAPIGELKAYIVTETSAGRYCGSCGKNDNKTSAVFCTACGFFLQDSRFLLLKGRREITFRFERLIEKNIQHKNIISFFETFSADGFYYVLGQAVPGTNLSDSQTSLSPSILIEWLRQLAEAMTFLHSNFIFNVRLTAGDIFLSGSKPMLVNFSNALIRNGSDKKLIQSDMKNLGNSFLNLLDRKSNSQINELRGILMNAANGQFASIKDLQHALDRMEYSETKTPSIEPQQNTIQSTNFSVSVGLASDVGIVRSLNEDSLAAFEQTSIIQSEIRPFRFFMVADGMGGHEAGEEASKIAVEIITREIRYLLPGDSEFTKNQVRQILEKAVFAANDKIFEDAQIQNNGMGTTITIALLLRNSAYIFNVGDGRAYHIQNNKLKLISQDHSLVYRLYKIGQLQYNEILTHPQSNQILCALGESQLKQNLANLEKQANHPYFFHVELKKGDGLLLCTDGLWQMIHEPDIENTLIRFPRPQQAVDELVKTANANGGVDNISLIYISTQ